MTRRTSARLAKAKGKGKRVKAQIDDDPGLDDDYGKYPLITSSSPHRFLPLKPSSEQIESEQEEALPPPRKRQRATTKSTQAPARKKQVRGKQGRLAGLVTMPIDIFTEVASHLLPGDIISLARSNKFFRNLLMHRSAIHIWHGAMRNVEGLPACPQGMNEPHFMALLFSKTCSMCGSPARANMDPALLVRLCASCRNTQLISLGSVPVPIMCLILFSGEISPLRRRSAGGAYVLREEIQDVIAEYEELLMSDDQAVVEKWTKERKQILDTRRKQAMEIGRFLDTLDRNRERELADTKTARRAEIKRRLKELGWSDEDMKFGWWSTQDRAWHELVSQPKHLTDRIWTNLQPKLIPILEANREERLEAERATRKYERKNRLSQLLTDIKKKDSTVLELEVPNPVAILSATLPTMSATYRGPFPDLTHALDWPVVRDLYETDLSGEEMEARFEEHREEIETLITAWKNRIQTHFANLLRQGYEEAEETIRPTVSISHSSAASNPLANASDDLKLLLRADSLFYKTRLSGPSKSPLSYGTLLSSEGLIGTGSTYYGFSNPTPRADPNLDHIHWYPEAHEAARELLADLGRPDASYLEMRSGGSVFVCGRCHGASRRNWDEMVQHYVEQKQLHAKLQDDESLAEAGITYNNVHDPDLDTEDPMIGDYTMITPDSMYGIGLLPQVCKVCEKIPAVGEVVASKSVIIKHLLNVHGITDPKEDEHYGSKKFTGWGLFGMDEYDSDESHYGCDCLHHLGLADYDEDMWLDPGNIFDSDDEEGDSDDDGYWW